MNAIADITELEHLKKIALQAAEQIGRPHFSSQDSFSQLVIIAVEIQSKLSEFPALGNIQVIIADHLLGTEEDPVQAGFRETAIGLLHHLKDVGARTAWGAEAARKLANRPAPYGQLPPDTAATFIRSMVKKWDI